MALERHFPADEAYSICLSVAALLLAKYVGPAEIERVTGNATATLREVVERNLASNPELARAKADALRRARH